MVLMMSAKMATPGLLKMMVFWNKVYGIIIFVDDVTKKLLSRDSHYIVDVLMWQKFGNCIISMREVITTSILLGFDQKNRSFEEWSWFKFNNLGLALGAKLKFYTSLSEEFKLKVRKFLGLIITYVEVTGEKLVRVAFLPPPSHPEHS